VSQPEDDLEDLPRAIAERLAAQERSLGLLTPRADEAVRRRAAAHFAKRGAGRRRARARWFAVSAAAAAAGVVFAILASRPIADDVDRSGRVDILDAFALARAHAAQSQFDSLAERVVSLRHSPL
jgi:hypothetical protein